MKKWILWALISSCLSNEGYALQHCYFNPEWVGEYVLQIPPGVPGVNVQIPQSRLSIGLDSIPILGECYQRRGNNFLLIERSGSHGVCYRCIRATTRTANVLSLQIQGLESCYFTAEQALEACPKIHSKELILVRSEDTFGTFCPFMGKFQLKYKSFTNGQFCYELSNCKGSHELEIKTFDCQLRNEPFDEVRIEKYQCLGHWSSDFPGKYFGIMKSKTQYKCIIYIEDNDGNFQVSITDNLFLCANQNFPGWTFQTFHLHRIPRAPLPSLVRKSQCQFPEKIQKKWEGLEIQNNSMVFRDMANLYSSEAFCIQSSFKHPERFLVYFKDQCDNGHYNCVWFRQRTSNVLELQFGRRPSTVPSFELCDYHNFWSKTWTTLARTDGQYFPACPVAGEYTGKLTDNPELCAKLYSNCNKLDMMYFLVSPCHNSTQIIEERTYQCLGQWEENGQLLAYVMRNDGTKKFECFVGATNDKNQIFLMESGFNCQRNLRAEFSGMRLTKQRNCFGLPNTRMEQSGKPWYVPESSTKKPKVDSNLEITIVRLDDIASVPIKSDDSGGTTLKYSSVKTILFFIQLSFILSK